LNTYPIFAYCTDMGTTHTSLRQVAAAELRAEMARQKRTGVELGAVLNCSQQSASRRITGEKAIELDELPLIAEWLGISVIDLLMPRDRAGDKVPA